MTCMKIVISFPKSVGFVNRDKRHTFLMVKILSKSLKHGAEQVVFIKSTINSSRFDVQI